MSCPFDIRRSGDYEALSHAAASAMADALRLQPGALFILATGGSPRRTYELLAEQGRAEPKLTSQMRILKLDEWGGLEMDDPATCDVYLRRLLVEPLGLPPRQFEGFHSHPADAEAECQRVGHWLQEHGPADVCVLGLGLNGHLGLNEPAESLQLWPHRAELTPESRRHGMLQCARTAPLFGLTIGMGDILNSNRILLLVSGESKREPLARLLGPDITPRFPASMLKLNRNVTLFCDEAALPRLP